MKKRIFALLLCTLLLCCSAAAELSRVADRAGLLTSTQVSALNDRCRELSEKYDLDVIIATTNDSRGMELGMYAADLVDYNSFRKDNIILVIAMDQRKYVCVTTGHGIDAFSDQALNAIYDAMESDMRAGRYYSACSTYLTRSEGIIDAYANGRPDSVYQYYGEGDDVVQEPVTFYERLQMGALFALIPAILIGWIIAAAQKGKMKTARKRDSAENYLTDMNLTRERDIYLYTTTVRHKIENDPPSSGGSSHSTFSSSSSHSTFSSSSGSSHGGGGSGRSF